MRLFSWAFFFLWLCAACLTQPIGDANNNNNTTTEAQEDRKITAAAPRARAYSSDAAIARVASSNADRYKRRL